MSCTHRVVTEKIGREKQCNECHEILWSEGDLAQELANLRKLYAMTKDELELLKREDRA